MNPHQMAEIDEVLKLKSHIYQSLRDYPTSTSVALRALTKVMVEFAYHANVPEPQVLKIISSSWRLMDSR